MSNRVVNPGITSAISMPVPTLILRRYVASAPLARPILSPNRRERGIERRFGGSCLVVCGANLALAGLTS